MRRPGHRRPSVVTDAQLAYATPLTAAPPVTRAAVGVERHELAAGVEFLA